MNGLHSPAPHHPTHKVPTRTNVSHIAGTGILTPNKSQRGLTVVVERERATLCETTVRNREV